MPIDIPMRFESEPLLLLVPDVYSPADCERFIALIESGAPSLATNNPMYRDQDRVIRDDPGAPPGSGLHGNKSLRFAKFA